MEFTTGEVAGGERLWRWRGDVIFSGMHAGSLNAASKRVGVVGVERPPGASAFIDRAGLRLLGLATSEY